MGIGVIPAALQGRSTAGSTRTSMNPSRHASGSMASVIPDRSLEIMNSSDPATRLGRIAAISPPMEELFGAIKRLAPSNVTITLIGETGTGKDVLAHAIHDASLRANRPFVLFDCGAVPANLVESELFGHERGAFTGAHAEHPGAFERARGGTLFLDEIGELPLDLQPRLLRVLDDRSVRRVGGTRDRQLDVRIISATNRDLSALVAAKQFRSDLYFRLGAAVIHLPPLRDRLEDLPLLIPQLLADLGRPDIRVARQLWRCLARTAGPATCASSRIRWPVRWLSRTPACSSRGICGSSRPRRRIRSSIAFHWAAQTLASIEQVGDPTDAGANPREQGPGCKAAGHRGVDALREAEKVRRLRRAPATPPVRLRGAAPRPGRRPAR